MFVESPLVSIIMPVYNSEQYLGGAIQSCLNQTMANFELICVDDHSSDESFKKISSLADTDKRIKVFQTRANAGSAVARNIGLIHARGRYICFLDSDDLFKPDFLAKQISFLKENGPFVFSSYDRLAKAGTTVFNVRSEVTSTDLLKGNDISCLTAFFDSKVLEKPLFDEKLKMNEDLYYWVNLIEKTETKKAYGNQESLAVYRIVKKSKSKRKLRSALWLFFIYHRRLHLSVFKSFYYIFKVFKYSLRKYENVA